MTEKPITILQLYPQDMNIYGDWGNVLVLKRRLEWHGYTASIVEYNRGGDFPGSVDIIVGGGGQDANQDLVQDDLLKIGPRLRSLADKGVPMLVICGMYQLFGTFFRTQDGHVIEGIRLLDIETHAGPERLVGNTLVASSDFGEITGYENHSGQTYLGKNALPLGRVIKGAGNNGQDETEGVRYKNVLGSYLHGSLLPKNPSIADFLIEQAVTNRYGEFVPSVINDEFAVKASEVAKKRPR